MKPRSALEPTEKPIRGQYYQQCAEAFIVVPTDGRRRRFVRAVSHILHVAVCLEMAFCDFQVSRATADLFRRMIVIPILEYARNT